jgi:uncharacterized protein (TIGR02145 family)
MIREILFVCFCIINVAYSQNVKIGSQQWCNKNLSVTTFKNGDKIPIAISLDEWQEYGRKGLPACCYYQNNTANLEEYGVLYNWFAVNDPRGLAPNGYHIPTSDEWKLLITFLGGEAIAGKKLQSTSGWVEFSNNGKKTCPNCKDWSEEYKSKVPCHTCKDNRTISVPIVKSSGNGNNLSGFNAFPGGYRDPSFFNYCHIGEMSGFWTLTDYKREYAIAVSLENDHSVGVGHWTKSDGLYVRCIKD